MIKQQKKRNAACKDRNSGGRRKITGRSKEKGKKVI
jgi:hypothetical protein